jgi:predicted transcriptional regulator of viral defense system
MHVTILETIYGGVKFTFFVNFMLLYIAMTSKQNPLSAARARLAGVLRASKDVVSTEIASRALGLDRRRAAQFLSRWCHQGWLRRVGHGLYISVPLDLASSEQIISDPWVLVPSLFGQGYIGGWTAAHHWDLTEQLFNETVVFTTQRIRKHRVNAQGAVFVLHGIPSHRLFGLKALWRGSTKISISDPARTLIDMIAAPAVGGGIDHVADCLKIYTASKTANRDLLVDYAVRFRSGVVFKRLGFLAETFLHDEGLASACRAHMTQGYARLDPSQSSHTLVTSWRLWVPPSWKR